MNHDTSTSPLALIYETAGGFDGELATNLAGSGWQARVLASDANVLLRERADLWVVQLAPNPSESLAFLQTLARLRQGVPLLVVVETHQLETYAHELARLLRNWPASTDLLVWPYTPEELQMRVALLTPSRTPVPEGGAIYERGALRTVTKPPDGGGPFASE